MHTFISKIELSLSGWATSLDLLLLSLEVLVKIYASDDLTLEDFLLEPLKFEETIQSFLWIGCGYLRYEQLYCTTVLV
jgi:hypothetical protein